MNAFRKILLAVCGCLLVCMTQARAATSESAEIAPQPLPSALKIFAQQSGLQLVYVSDVALGRQSRGAPAGLSNEQTIAHLLEGTGLSYEFLNERTVSIRSPVSTGQGANRQGGSVVEGAGGVQYAEADKASTSAQPEQPAAKTSDTLEEVVVTAQKRKERLLDVPIAITSISGDELDASRIRNINDLALAVPGLSVQKIAPGYMQVAIRGINNERGSAGLTGIYLDEVPLTAAVGQALGNADLGTQDLQRVEVLKGPQGTLFGDGSVGGTIRYITREPVLDKVEGSLRSSYYLTNGGDPSWDLRGVANFPVVDGVFAVRAVGSYEDTGGWIDKVAGPGQPVLEKNINDGKSHDFRIKALLKASDNFSITGLIGIGRFNGGANNNVNVDSLDDSHFRPAVDPNRDEVNRYKYNVYNLTATYALGFANLMSSTSQFTLDRSDSTSQIAPVDGGALLQLAFDRLHTEVDAFSQELRLTSSAEGRFKWTGGLFYKNSKALGNPDPGDSRSQLKINNFTLPASFSGPANGTSETKAAFGDVSCQLTNRLEIGGGLRYVEDHREGYTPTDKAATFHEQTYDKATYRAFATYKASDNVSVYVNTSTGFRAGDFNDPSGVAAGGPLLTKPENVIAYEVGAKARFFDGRLYSSISLFRNNYKDILGSIIHIDQNTGQANGSYSYNPGTARIDGVDWDVQWRPTHNWVLGVAGDILDSRYIKITGNTDNLVLVGDPVNGSPNYGFSLFTQLGINLASDARGTLHLDWNRRGRARDTERNFVWLADIAESSIINMVNARFDVDWHDWTYGVFAQNILDDRGSLNATTANLQWQSRPRSIGITATRRF